MKLIDQYLKLYKGNKEEFLSSAVLVDITPVAQWFYEDDDRLEFDVAKDMPVLIPPWNLTWMEYQSPEWFLEGKNKYRHPFAGRRAGAQIVRIELPDSDNDMPNDPLGIMGEYINAPYETGFFDRETKNARMSAFSRHLEQGDHPHWVIGMMTMAETSSGIRPLGKAVYCVGEDGNLLEDMSIFFVPKVIASDLPDHGPAAMDFWVYALAITFFHCKNIQVIDLPGLPPKVLAKRQKEGRPEVKFKTLVVEPLRKQTRLESSGEMSGGSLRRALHIARGHFKDYRDGGGLFGQHHGLYWWEMHVRGDADSGVIVKDYKINNQGEKPRFDD